MVSKHKQQSFGAVVILGNRILMIIRFCCPGLAVILNLAIADTPASHTMSTTLISQA